MGVQVTLKMPRTTETFELIYTLSLSFYFNTEMNGTFEEIYLYIYIY